MRSVIISLLCLFCGLQGEAQNSYFIEAGFDPRMLTNGPYEGAPSALDLLTKVGIHTERLDYYVYGEFFNATSFYSYGVGAMVPYRLFPKEALDRDTSLDVAFGLDIGLISRPEFESTTGSFGFNIETRFNIGKHFTLKYLANWRYRSDLESIYNETNNFKYGGYLTVVYNFHK